MEQEEVNFRQPSRKFENLNKVTPLSKYLAMVLFVILPFVGGYVGYTVDPVKVVEVQKMVEMEKTQAVNETTNGVDVNSYEFRERLYNEGERPFLFAEPGKASLILENGQCEPFDGGLYRYNQTSGDYELISKLEVDREKQPCLLGVNYLGTFGSKYYFAEPFGKQQLYVVDTSLETPVLEALAYSQLRVGDYSNDFSSPEHLILVRVFDQDALSIFNMQTGKSREIYNDPDYSYFEAGIGLHVFATSFTEDEITISVLPLAEPDENGRRYPLAEQPETVTIPLKTIKKETSFDNHSKGTLSVLYASGILSFTDDATGETSEIMTINPTPDVYVFNNKIYTGTKNRVFQIDPFSKTERAIDGTDFAEDVWISSVFIQDEYLYYLVVTNMSVCESPQVECDSHLYRKNMSNGQVEHLTETTAINIMGYSTEEELLYLGGFCSTGIFTYGSAGLNLVGKWCQIDVTDEQSAENEKVGELISEKLGNPTIVEAIQVSDGKLLPSSEEVDITSARIHFY